MHCYITRCVTLDTLSSCSNGRCAFSILIIYSICIAVSLGQLNYGRLTRNLEKPHSPCRACVRAKCNSAEAIFRRAENPRHTRKLVRSNAKDEGDREEGRTENGRSIEVPMERGTLYTPANIWDPLCTPRGSHPPARRFYRRRRDTSRDTPAFIDPTPCFFCEKVRMRQPGDRRRLARAYSARRERERMCPGTTVECCRLAKAMRQNKFAQLNPGNETPP